MLQYELHEGFEIERRAFEARDQPRLFLFELSDPFGQIGPATVKIQLAQFGCFISSTSRGLEVREREETAIEVRDKEPSRSPRLLERWGPGR